MDLFNVYPLFDIEPVKASGCTVWDKNGTEYLDLYGGHAVISIGHSHPYYIEKITHQLKNIGFYSNSVQIPIQEELAQKLGHLSGKEDYHLFYCNSGAEANENALKLASFHNGKKKIISFSKGFHGRTSLAVEITDNPSIVAPVNHTGNSIILPFNDEEVLEKAFQEEEICAVIIEGIQGIGGINIATESFLKKIRSLCDQHNAVYIADAIQCGYGRSGKFYSHDYAGVDADIYTMAKGMGNGFPIGAIAIAPKFKAVSGMLGTTFGGNHLACAAGVAVLDVMKQDKLIENAASIGSYLMNEIRAMNTFKEVRGRGLMIGLEMEEDIAPIRKSLLFDHHIFTGVAGKKVMRLLPPLTLTKNQADQFLEALSTTVNG